MKRYRATQKLLDAIKKAEFVFSGVTNTEYFTNVYDCLVDINSNWTLTLRIDEEAILKNPDYFEEIKYEQLD